MTLTSDLAAEINNANADNIPPRVLSAVKAMVIDHIGISFMGHRYTGTSLSAYAREMSGLEEVVVLGEDFRAEAGQTAGINAQMAHNSGMENTGPGLHAGPVIVHTALAAAQKNRQSGPDMLAAIASGYELNTRFHYARTADEDVRHLNCVCAAVASRSLGFDVGTTALAMSIAWEIPMRSLRYLKPKVPKRISPFPMGGLFAPQAGFLAANLAATGLDSFPDEVDYLGDEYDLDKLADSSRAYSYVEDGLFLKKWPSSNLCHMVLQLITEIVARENLRPADISSVRVGLPNLYMIPHQNEPAPETYWQGIYSAPWAISMCAHGIKPGPDWFTTERFDDPSCKELARKVTIVEHLPASEAVNAKEFLSVEGWVDIETSKGRFKESKSMRDTAGSPTTPLTEWDLTDKFLSLVSPDLGESRSRDALKALNSMDTCADICELSSFLLPQ